MSSGERASRWTDADAQGGLLSERVSVGSRLHHISVRLRAASDWLTAGFAISLAAYLTVLLVGVVVPVPQAAQLTLVPAGLCAVGLGLGMRSATAEERASIEERAEATLWPGIAAGILLAVFVATYLAINTVPIVTSQDESAIVNGAYNLTAEHSLRSTSPLNDRYHTNIFGALHVIYQTPTKMYYRVFPGSAVLYAPFSRLPGTSDYSTFAVFFGTVTVMALYVSTWKLLASWLGALFAGLLLATSPAYGHWAVTVFNNVPVLALELCSLAVILWASRDRPWQFAIAGAIAAVAVFARWTEVVYVLPLAALAWWRAPGWRAPVAFLGASLLGPLLIAFTNELFYGDVFFSAYGGSKHLVLPGTFPVSGQGIAPPVGIQSYVLNSFGAPGSTSLIDEAKNMVFHFRYLASSTFAFPFVAIAFIALAWRIAAGRRYGWLLAAVAAVATAIIVFVYGRLSHNYYGYGQPIVRSSFIRYALLFYAIASIAAAAFFLDAMRALQGRRFAMALPVALLGIVVTIGIAQSYDAKVYGFNRLNDYRSSDENTWNEIKTFLDSRPTKPVIVGGPSAEKLIDTDYEHYAINIDTLPLLYRDFVLFPVLQRADQERDVYVITSPGNPDDKAFRFDLYSKYTPMEVLRIGDFRVYLLNQRPPSYALGGIDVWMTYGAYDRWAVTPGGYLKSTADTPYFQLTNAFDVNHDDRFDQDVILRVQFLDKSDKPKFSISALDSRQDWQPIEILSGTFGNTGQMRTFDIRLPKGAYYKGEFIASPGITFGLIGVLPSAS
jgi:hypothetical protein